MGKSAMKLDQKTIAEIKNYSNPPVEVHQIFRACFLLLGTPLKSTEKWNDCLVLIGKLGKDSLLTKMSNCDVTKVPKKNATQAAKLLKSYTPGQMRNVSSGAVLFYDWSLEVINKVLPNPEDEEEAEKDQEDFVEFSI